MIIDDMLRSLRRYDFYPDLGREPAEDGDYVMFDDVVDMLNRTLKVISDATGEEIRMEPFGPQKSPSSLQRIVAQSRQVAEELDLIDMERLAHGFESSLKESRLEPKLTQQEIDDWIAAELSMPDMPPGMETKVVEPVDLESQGLGEDGHLITPRTKGEMVALRMSGARFISDNHPENVEFTCDSCDFAPRCDFAFDPYNTDGDCLDAK